MQTVIDTFNDRVAEINLYYNVISKMYSQKDTIDFYSEDFLKILKSNAILMIYNLVESSIMGGILAIYDELQRQQLSYCNVRSEIQNIWFSYKFNQVYDKKAHYNSYKEKATEIIDDILTNKILVLNRKATDISGNLDAEKIRHICQDHGIIVDMPANCHGGFVLNDVKERRNDLAHGTISFVECGRVYTIDDLQKTKDETIAFLDAILKGMKKYYDEKLFLNTQT